MAGSKTLGLLACGTALGWMMPQIARAQETPTPPAATPTGAATPEEGSSLDAKPAEGKDVIVTGSRIRQDPNNSALPLQVITNQELVRNGISNPE